MTAPVRPDLDALAREVRLYVFGQAADSARIPQPDEIARALHREPAAIREALHALAEGRVIILAPNDGNIWAANPFCAVPSAFRVESSGRRYWGICIWDALGIPAALGRDATIRARCGDCGDGLTLEVRQGRLTRSEGVIHFAIPARHWWDNIGFT